MFSFGRFANKGARSAFAMSPHRKRHSALVPDAATKRRRGDEKPADKGVFEAHLEHLSQTSEADSTSSIEREELEEGLGTTTSIAFQVFDIETYHEQGSATSFDRTNVKLYGVTKRGNSICATVVDYFPHFYFQAPEGFAGEHLDVAQRNLNNAIANSMRRANSNLQLSSVVVDNLVHLSIVNGENIYYYRGSEKKYPFIRVSGSILALNKAKQELKSSGFSYGAGSVQVGTLFEANIDTEVKFMASTGIVGCGWVEIPVGKAVIVTEKIKTSRCQLEVVVKQKDLISHDPEGEWAVVAPIRTLSFDIECMGRRGVFPDATEDPVIQIANMVKMSLFCLLMEGESEPFIRNCFVLGSCAPVIGSEIIQCESEEELLEKWSNPKWGLHWGERARVINSQLRAQRRSQRSKIVFVVGM
uniref:DNA polymerase delta catalytic subunit n=1 Tax=Haemonchus contortus TaxID=6289 RepID=W6NIW5_HAECO